MKQILLLASVLFGSISLMAQHTNHTSHEEDKKAIKALVEQFLMAAGNYDTESIPAMFTAKANISGASLKDGKWTGYTMTIQEFVARLKSETNPRKYEEPVNNWIIHSEDGQLAFVRADATLSRDGQPKRKNIDYFTLIRENGKWKILNGSYVSKPIPTKQQ